MLLVFAKKAVSVNRGDDGRSLSPLSAGHILDFVPRLRVLRIGVTSISFSPLVSSDSVRPDG